MDNQLNEIGTISKESHKIGYNKAKEDIKMLIENKIKDIEIKADNRHMNDLEYGAYKELGKIIDVINDME